jgi:hypothetical protein
MTGSGWSWSDRAWFYDGQLLSARDLNDDSEHEARMRAAHVVAMHDAWGVVTGFDLAVDDAERGVTVGPGVAYDCRGRAVVLASEVSLAGPYPPPGQTDPVVYLMCSYPACGTTVADHHGVSCRPTPVLESIALRWVFALGLAPGRDTMRLGEDIPLAAFVLTADGRLSKPDRSVRRHVRAIRPRVGSGLHEIPDDIELVGDPQHSVSVDTSGAGFSTTPHYFAWLASNPWAADSSMGNLALGPFVSITKPSRTSFHLDLIFTFPNVPLMDGGGATTGFTGASIFWMGLEPYGGCLPVIAASGSE